MTRFVIDPRTLLHVLEGGRTEARPSAGGARLDPVARNGPHVQKVQHDDLTEQQALALHEHLTQTKLRLFNDRVSRRIAWDIAREKGWDTIS